MPIPASIPLHEDFPPLLDVGGIPPQPSAAIVHPRRKQRQGVRKRLQLQHNATARRVKAIKASQRVSLCALPASHTERIAPETAARGLNARTRQRLQRAFALRPALNAHRRTPQSAARCRWMRGSIRKRSSSRPQHTDTLVRATNRRKIA